MNPIPTLCRLIDSSEPPETFVLALQLADAYEEEGGHIVADGLRWLGRNEKHPKRYSNGQWDFVIIGSSKLSHVLPFEFGPLYEFAIY